MSDRTELLKLHDWDELLFGGFYCLHCTPADVDPLDDPIAWPCQPLRGAGVTDDEARALIEAHREKAAAEYEAKKRAEQAELQRRVDNFNDCHPVGTPVFAYPGCRPEDHADATRLVTRTRSKASVLSGHTDVVWVDGHSACIALSHVDPVSEEQFTEARAEETAAAVADEGALPVPVGDQPQPLDEALTPEPIPARWDRTVILPEHPNGDLDGQTIVCCIADDGTKRPIGLFLDDEHREALGLLLVDPNGEDEEHAALLAEVQRLKTELVQAQEDIAFTERITLPDLRRTVEHHQDGKQRWRDRAEKAEARVAELEAERHTTNEALSDAAETLRADRDRITELENRLGEHDRPGFHHLARTYPNPTAEEAS